MFSGLGFMVLGWILFYDVSNLALGDLPLGAYVVLLAFIIALSGLFASLLTERQKRSKPRS